MTVRASSHKIIAPKGGLACIEVRFDGRHKKKRTSHNKNVDLKISDRMGGRCLQGLHLLQDDAMATADRYRGALEKCAFTGKWSLGSTQPSLSCLGTGRP